MANATNPRDYIQRVSIDDATWTEIKVVNKAAYVSLKQLGSETLSDFLVKHRSDDAGEDAEFVAAGDEWKKNEQRAHAYGGATHMQAGDTIGFFQKAGAAATITLVIREHEG